MTLDPVNKDMRDFQKEYTTKKVDWRGYQTSGKRNCNCQFQALNNGDRYIYRL